MRPAFLVIVVLLVATLVVGFVWVRAVNDFVAEHGHGSFGSCARVNSNLRSRSQDALVPDDRALVPVNEAYRRFTARESWAIQYRSDPSDQSPFVATLTSDGDSFRMNSSVMVAAAGPGTSFDRTPSSFLWVASCTDMDILPSSSMAHSEPGGTKIECVSVRRDGEAEVYSYRYTVPNSSCAADATDVIDHEVRLVRGEFSSYRLTVRQAGAPAAPVEWRAVAPTDASGPMPWQVIPGWFAELVSSSGQ